MKPVPQSLVTHGMVAFAQAVVADKRFPLGTWTAPEMIDGVSVVGHVVTHTVQAATGRHGVFRACEIYYADAGVQAGPGNVFLAAPSGEVHPAAIASEGGAQAHGIDVSDYQPGIDWATAEPSTDVDFVFIKASEYHEAKLLRDHWTKAGDVGLPRGGYHFFRIGLDPREQVLHFLDAVHAAEAASGAAELGYVIDVESQTSKAGATASQQLGGFAPGAFLDRVELAVEELRAQIRATPIVYASSGFWGLLPARGIVEARTELWAAAYRRTPPPPFGAWKAWRFWQYTDKQAIPGYAHAVDGNVFAGTLAELRAWAGLDAPTGDLEAGGRLLELARKVDAGEEGLPPG